MKNIIIALIAFLAMFSVTSCGQNKPYNNIPKEYVSNEEYFEKNGFQDYTDFCFYKYESTDCFTDNEKYTMITESNIDEVRGYFINFRKWIDGERIKKYTFNDDCISVGDYIRIDTLEGKTIGDGQYRYEKYNSYDVYLFDVESLTLTYIHNNI